LKNVDHREKHTGKHDNLEVHIAEWCTELFDESLDAALAEIPHHDVHRVNQQENEHLELQGRAEFEPEERVHVQLLTCNQSNQKDRLHQQSTAPVD